MRLVSTNAAETAVRTLMIGAIDRIEQKFGYTWGHNKKEEDLTEEDEDMYEIFMELRDSILDYGNEQICKLKGIRYDGKRNNKNH